MRERLAYSLMEECCASNAVMKVRVFLSQRQTVTWCKWKHAALIRQRILVQLQKSQQHWFVAQLDQSIRLLTGGLCVRVAPGQQWMNSSTAEQVFVKHQVESSNLSSSAALSCWQIWHMHPTANRKKEVRIFCTTQIGFY